jgi:chromosome segregation ATPase
MPESRVTSGELKVTQSDLHEKGCQLTKVWSDLFSLLSKYQADLMVKENEIEVLEQQLETKQQMLKSSTNNDTREVTNLQGEIQAKDLALAKYRADLLNSEEAMQRLQMEMRSNSELLTQCRAEVLENQEKLIKTRSDVDKLRFELTSKDEQLRVKDALLEKVQAQMLREVSELSVDVNSLRHKLNLEKTAHDETKKTLLSISKQNQVRNSNTERFTGHFPHRLWLMKTFFL